MVYQDQLILVGKLDARDADIGQDAQLPRANKLSNTCIFDFQLHEWTCVELQHAPEACYNSQFALHRDQLVLFGGMFVVMLALQACILA